MEHQVHTPTPSQTTPETDASSEAVSAVTIRLPPYWERNPAVWFLQVESQFQLSRITSQQRQFHHVVGALPSTAAEEVVDIITSFRNNPPARPYDQLKAALLERTAASERTRIQQLLSAEELGDRRPSQLLRRMTQLLGTSATTMDTAVLRELFLQRLPSQVQMVLATATAMDLTSLAALADKVMEVATPNLPVASISTPTQSTPPTTPVTTAPTTAGPSEVDRLCARLEQLIAATTCPEPSAHRERQRHRSSTPNRRRRERSDSPGPRMCFYHRRFGANARRCLLPCTWSENSTADH